MRNLLVFVLVLIGIFYVRRALRRSDGRRGGGGAAPGGADTSERETARPERTVEVEQMVACAHCGLHVPESEGIRGVGGIFCSEAHRRLGPRR